MDIKCKCCGKKPEEIKYYVDFAKNNKGYSPQEVAMEDGTYNPSTGMFYCNECYIKIGMPLGKA